MSTVTRTHLSPTTGKREPCTASVRACRFGGHEDVAPSTTSMTEFYAEVPAAAYSNVTHPAVHRALTADLNYAGPKPEWWAKHESEAAAHPQLPSRVELLDVIDTPAGKVVVVWQETSHRKNDTGMILDSGINVQSYLYLDWKNGANLGYVNLSSRTPEAFERSFGTDEFAPFRFQQRFGGSSLGLRDYDADEKGPGFHNLEGEELLAKRRQVWLRMRQSSDRAQPGASGYQLPDGKWLASYQVGEAHIPDDAAVKRELHEMTKQINRKIKSEMRYFSTPFVDFSRVEGPLGGKGYGSSLYVYAARHLAKRELALRGSGLQSDEAQAVWKRFKQAIPQHVKSMTLRYRGKASTAYTLDFRA